MTGNYHEWMLEPKDYRPVGEELDIQLINPPLVRTSVKELADNGWKLYITARYIPGYVSQKIRYRFFDPKDGSRQLIFKYGQLPMITTIEQAIVMMYELPMIPSYGWLRHSYYHGISEVHLERMLSEFNRLKTIAQRKPSNRPKDMGVDERLGKVRIQLGIKDDGQE